MINLKVTKKNLGKVVEKIMNKVIGERRIVYFNIGYWDLNGVSPCFFTPIVLDGKKYHMFIDDYEKILVLLLSHPKVREIEYDEKEGCVSAFFDVPEEYWKEEEVEELEEGLFEEEDEGLGVK